MANDEVATDRCMWTGCKVKALPPCLVPKELACHVGVLKQDGLLESLPRHAVRCGCWMDASTLKNVCISNKVPEPAGTGAANKQGVKNIMKQDWARALVEHFFPSDVGDPPEFLQEKEDMIAGILGQKKRNLTVCPEDVLQSVAALDPNEACVPMFRGLKAMAKEMAEAQDRRAREAGNRTPRGLSASDSQLHTHPEQSPAHSISVSSPQSEMLGRKL